jgi:GDP-D-mannose dehydratase
VNKIKVYRCDIRNYDALKNVIEDIKPGEIYHLAAISFVPTSLKEPKLTFDTNLYGTLNLYQAVIDLEINPINHIGPSQAPDFVCSSFAKQIAEIEKGLREPILKVGNLEAKRDFTDVRDIVRGYWLALDKGEPGEVYNICSERAIQIKGLLNHLLELSSRKVEIMKDPKRMRPSDNPILQGDSSKFRRRSGWKPEILLDKTLKDILEYWRKVL